MKIEKAGLSLRKDEQRALGLPSSLTIWPKLRSEELADLADTMKEGWTKAGVNGNILKSPLAYRTNAVWAEGVASLVHQVVGAENGVPTTTNIPTAENRQVFYAHDLAREAIAPLLIGE